MDVGSFLCCCKEEKETTTQSKSRAGNYYSSSFFFFLLPFSAGWNYFRMEILYTTTPFHQGSFSLFSLPSFSQFHAWENFPIRAAVPPFIPPSVAATVCLFCYTVHKVVKNAPRGGGYQKRSRKMPVFKIGFRSEGSILILSPLFRVN